MNSRAYAEVYQLIQYLPEKEYKLIPKWQIDYFKDNMDKTVGKLFSINTDISNIELSFDAKTILLSLFHLYIANDIQKKKLEKYLYDIEEKQKSENYKPLFQKNETISKPNTVEQTNQQTALVVVKKDNFIQRIKKFFLNIFKHK